MSAVLVEQSWRQYCCVTCGLIYDEAKGWPEEGFASGTRWEQIPDDWTCPDCSASKSDFQLMAG